MKKNFLGAFWILLAVAISQLIVAVWVTHVYLHFLYSPGRYGYRRIPRVLVGIYIFPTLMLLEAGIYWLIRRRNRYYALSWTHGGIIAAAFALNIIFNFLLRPLRDGIFDTEARVHWVILARQQRYLYWGLVAIAHLAFFAVLANCARKEEPPLPAEGGENLLDDVEL